MDTFCINSFLEGSSKVLGSFGVKFNAGKPYLTSGEQYHNQITLEIGVLGKFNGKIFFNMSVDAALKIIAKMMNDNKVSCIDEMGKSALSELVNMISGNTATIFHNNGISIDITPPSLKISENSDCYSQSKAVGIPLDLNLGEEVELAIMLK